MQANPDKFQAISIGWKTHEKNLSFMLQGNKIDEVKLLGVTFVFKLTFNSHVSHICKSCEYTGVCLFIILKTFIAMESNLLNLGEAN
jgi:hypothetical protein